MLRCFGWAVIQASRLRYVGASLEQSDALDEEVDREEQVLWAYCRAYLERCDSWLRWQFSERLNNHRGMLQMLQFHTSRNHRSSTLWDLGEFIARQSDGSFGVLYVHDDEDFGRLVEGLARSFSNASIPNYRRAFVPGGSWSRLDHRSGLLTKQRCFTRRRGARASGIHFKSMRSWYCPITSA